MITRELLLKLFDAAYMERWNDKLRPMPFIELDKQAHKMIIAWFLGKYAEDREGFSWIDIIEGGLFDFLQRLVVTDIKPSIFHKIKQDKQKYRELNAWIFKQVDQYIQPLGSAFCKRFKEWFDQDESSVTKRILSAAHLYASIWEFEIIARSNPYGYDIETISNELRNKLENYYDLEGLKEISLYKNYRKFVDLCGQLRFQYRWANVHRIPKTSVLGHSLLVAQISYLFTSELSGSPKRIYNNFFSGLFHDLPEVLTRDIISPVKKSIEGIMEIIKTYEQEQMKLVVYPLIPDWFHSDINLFCNEEFTNRIIKDGKVMQTEIDQITRKYNEDRFSPRDGALVKCADDLSAFIEAYAAIENGNEAGQFHNVIAMLSDKYSEIGTVGGIDVGAIYREFTR
jgi:putative hydrolase of HD superfamily